MCVVEQFFEGVPTHWRHWYPRFKGTGALPFPRRELAEELARALIGGYRLRDVIIVEYCDTADPSGIFRLYCASIVGHEIIPQVMVHNRNWVTKWEGRVVDDDKANEQQDYVQSNPHAAWLNKPPN